MNEITLKTLTMSVTLLEERVIYIHPLPGTTQTKQDAEENLEVVVRELGSNLAVLVDARGSGVLTREAREVYAQREGYMIAQALLVESRFSRIAANLYIRISTPRHPTRMFTDQDAALRWLRGHLR